MDKLNKQELRRLAVEAMPGYWHVEDGMGMVYDEQMDFVCDTGEDEPCKSAFIAAANPAAILSLLDELEQYRKDALRYQWLRDQPGFQLWLGEVCREEQVSSVEPSADIDDLMAKEGGANG